MTKDEYLEKLKENYMQMSRKDKRAFIRRFKKYAIPSA